MSRDDELPKYELNMTDYDEGWLGALRVELSADPWVSGTSSPLQEQEAGRAAG